MSRFANIEKTEVISTDCRCDGKPHAADEVTIRSELPYGAQGVLADAGRRRNPEVYNFNDARIKLLELGIVSWNLIGPTGQPWDPSPVTIGLLDEPTVNWIAGELNTRIEGKKKLPNASAGRSPNGSSATGSPDPTTPTTPTPASSTTSS